MSNKLMGELIPAVIPGLRTLLRTVHVSRQLLAKSLRQLADDIENGEHIPDEALGQARADGATLDDLLAGKN